MSVIVTMRHVREAKLCSRGSREWCAEHGIDWYKFLEEGLPVEVLEVFDDAMIKAVIAQARKEQE